MNIGFTGTRHGANKTQLELLRIFLEVMGEKELFTPPSIMEIALELTLSPTK